MVVVAVEGSLLRHSVDHILISGTPSTTPPSLLSTKQQQQQQQQHRRFSSSSASSSSSAASIYSPYVTYSSSASSTASSLVATAIPRRTSIGGGGSRITKAMTFASLGHSSTVPIANPSRPAIASRPAGFVSGPTSRPVYAAIAETAGEGLKWWERGSAPNMIDVHSTQQFVDALSAAGDKLVVVEFFASWCPSCRALYPKFCKMAAENSDMFFLKVNFDENKPMCKSLNVKVLPFFHLYRGAEGRVDSFSCSLAKLQRLRDAISKHHDGPCEDCAPPELIGDALDSLLDRVSPVRPSPDQPAAAARPSE